MNKTSIITVLSSASLTIVILEIFLPGTIPRNLSETTMIGIILFLTSLCALCLFLAINFDRIFPDKKPNTNEVNNNG